jgi:hypothetical protein
MARTLSILTAALLALALGGCGGSDDTAQPAEGGSDKSRRGGGPSDPELAAAEAYVVERYCLYGAASRAQLKACLQHVTIGYVRRQDTNASAYGFYNLRRCLADAGPFCTKSPPPDDAYDGY